MEGLRLQAEHEIPTGTAAPLKQLPRRTPHGLRKEVVEQVQIMPETGVIRCSNSPW